MDIVADRATDIRPTGAMRFPGSGRQLGPDVDGVVRVRALAYGFTPKAVTEARLALRSLRGRDDVRLAAFDVGRNFAAPRTRAFAALVADLDDVRESMDFCTLALPSGDVVGLSLEFSLACAMSTLDRGASILCGDGGEHEAPARRRLAWALGPSYRGGPVRLADDEALAMALVTVVCDPSARPAAAGEVAARLSRRQLPFMSLDRSLAIVRRRAGQAAHA